MNRRPSRLPAAKARPLVQPTAPASLHDSARQVALNLSHAFAALLAIGIAERGAYAEVLRAGLVANPAFLGLWAVWEPDAVGGADAHFRRAPGHDASGRFVPYWNREDGDLRLDPVTGFEQPGEGDWYWVPKVQRQPCRVEAYLYPVRGRRQWIASEIVPISARGLCLGVVGVDWTIAPAAPAAPARRAQPEWPIVQVMGGDHAAAALRALTAREHEVYFWLSQGKSNEEIGIILGISGHTVKNHLDHIFQKLGVGNRLAAALFVQAASRTGS